MSSASANGTQPELREGIRDVFQTFAAALGMIKMFPPDHVSVVSVRGELWAKVQALLDAHRKVDVEVRETAFLFEGETVYKDDNLLKSLPYLFFKDGVERLVFRRGLDEAEFRDFLDLIRADAVLPAEESDIVNLLWEREFPHIGYTTADDYLEAKIPALERKPWEEPVNTAAFDRGRIDIVAEDMDAILKAGLSRAAKEPQENTDAAGSAAPLDKRETQFLQALLETERSIPAEKEFLDLFFDLLALEDRPAPLASMLQFLDSHHGDLLKRSDFGHAALLLGRMDALKSDCFHQTPAKSRDLDRISHRIREGVSLAGLKDQAEHGKVEDAVSFFRYLEQVGARAVPLAADLFEEMEDGIVRSEAFAYLLNLGRQNIEVLAGLARDSMPVLSKGIVAALARTKDRRAISQLARFKDSKLKAVRLDAVKALAAIDDPLARKILHGFLADADPEVRRAAAAGLNDGEKGTDGRPQ